ncbi:MAG: hypothetical protein ACYC27_10150 [Armatimonadota bacterium]
MVSVPLLIEVYGILLHVNPITPGHPLTLGIAFVLTALIVKGCEANAGKNGVPDQRVFKISALLFGLVRTFELIIVLWIPKEIFHTGFRTNLFFFVLFAKVYAYLSYIYWVNRLASPADVSAIDSGD